VFSNKLLGLEHFASSLLPFS